MNRDNSDGCMCWPNGQDTERHSSKVIMADKQVIQRAKQLMGALASIIVPPPTRKMMSPAKGVQDMSAMRVSGIAQFVAVNMHLLSIRLNNSRLRPFF